MAMASLNCIVLWGRLCLLLSTYFFIIQGRGAKKEQVVFPVDFEDFAGTSLLFHLACGEFVLFPSVGMVALKLPSAKCI